MRKSFTYEINIKFNKKLNQIAYLDRRIPYLGSQSNQDRLKITKDGISITCIRSNKTELGNIFHNYNSSIYTQILKSILYCLALDFECYAIKQITITLKNHSGVLIGQSILKRVDITQPLDNKITTSLSFVPNRLEVIFDETPKGKAVLIALSSWLKAVSTKNRTYSFEKYWVGFNALYTHIHSYLVTTNIIDVSRKVANEQNKLISTRDFLLTNHNILQFSLNIASGYNQNTLRQNFRWYKMAKNEFDTLAKTGEFWGFISRYKDERILAVCNELLPFRAADLTVKGLYQKALDHISNNLQLHIVNDVEVVLILCFRYIYYVRNKDFHGEKIDASFRLVMNKETNEYLELNEMLSSLVVDLINGNNIF